MDDSPVLELFAGYFDWMLRFWDTVSHVEDVKSSVVYPSGNTSVSEEDVAPIPDGIVALDEVSAPCDASEATLVSIEEIPCLAHAAVDEGESLSPDSSDASDVEPLTEGVSECQPLPSAAGSQQEELPGDLVEDGEAAPFDLSFMCLAPTPLCVAGLESCPASLFDYLDGLSDTELAVVKEVGRLDSLFTAQWHATRQSLISALTPRQDELPDGDLAEDDVNMIEDSSIDALVLMFEGIAVESAST